MPQILSPRTQFKPFEYPQYFEYFRLQNVAHWVPTEIPMEADVSDYRFKLTETERNLINQVLRFFTQGDLEVNDNYNTNLIPYFPKPEIRMMLSAFAGMEATHTWAYAYLNDTLGLPETEYSAFLSYKSMKDKYDYIRAFDVKNNVIAELAMNLAVFGGFMEGVSLFSSFAILMNFTRLGKLKGMGQVVTWSMRDEGLHSEGVSALFRDVINEHQALWTPAFKEKILSACVDMVHLEDAFIDECFSLGPVDGLKPEEVKGYIRFMADRRLNGLGLDKHYGAKNPLPWLDALINAREHANFFEAKSTSYSKGSVVDDWDT